MKQQIPAGYKQTEVGVIPENWEVKRLAEVADPNQKWSFTGGPFGSNLKSSDYTNDGVRIIQLQNIGDGEFHNDYAVFTSPEKADELLSCNIYPGEIILSKMGDPVARACIIPPHHERYLMCSDGIRLAVNPKRFNTYFVYLSINAPDFRTRAENAGTGSTRKRIGLTELRNLELLCPELPEQGAIAEALSDADALIESLEQLITKKRHIKQGAMQELLTGKRRLPGFSGEWEMKHLGELATFHKGKGLPKSAIDASGAELCIHYGELFTHYPETIREINSRTCWSSNVFRSIANDVLMPTSDVTPNGLAKASCIRTSGVILGGDILVIRPTDRLFGSFLSYVIRHAEKQILLLVTGSTVFHLYAADMKKFTFLVPPVDEQRAIVSVLDEQTAEIAALETRLAKTRALKQGMMHNLLTGRIRLL